MEPSPREFDSLFTGFLLKTISHYENLEDYKFNKKPENIALKIYIKTEKRKMEKFNNFFLWSGNILVYPSSILFLNTRVSINIC